MLDLLTQIDRRTDYLTKHLPKRKTTQIKHSTVGLEAEGWESWLKVVAPRTFTGSFADFHRQLWDWYWRITNKRCRSESLTDEDLVFLAWWFRGGGKSSNMEWAAIAEGAIVHEGYVLYVSGTQQMAEEHVNSIRERIESEEIARYYPHLSNPLVGRHGNQYGWRQNFLATDGGWAVRPIGLDVGVRGGKFIDLRPTLIIFDDVDDVRDSPHVVQAKERTISRSIIPTGTKDTIKLFGQNLIHRNSVANRIHTRTSTLLARRIESEVVQAFRDPKIEFQQTDKGPRYILVGGTPNWKDIDMEACQNFLDDSGPEAFLAEYQHDFSASEQGRVIPEYDEATHVITWSMFEQVYGRREIPAEWHRQLGHDVGFTEGHISAWTWITTAGMNSKLPGKRFRYRGMTFVGASVDDMAVKVKEAMAGEHVGLQKMSHEALSERLTYNTKYGFHFQACDSAKTAGIAQWRYYLKRDHSQPHPFKADSQRDDGTWVLGAPGMFDIVADDQYETPTDDRGLKTHRQQTVSWQWRPTPLTDSGMVKDEPVKADEDTNDATRMITATWGPSAKGLTQAELNELKLDPSIRAEAIVNLPLKEQEQALHSRRVHLGTIEAQQNKPVGRALPKVRFKR